MKQKTQWVKPRHRIAVALVHLFFGFYVRMRYHITIEPFREQCKRPYLIVMNHQTAYDQFFVGMTFHRPVYYVASEDLFSMGWVSSLIRWLVEPIPIRKQTTDIQAVKNCIRVAREGGTICLAPEGNRTFHGKTIYMNPAIGGLAKKLGLPIAIFRIEGVQRDVTIIDNPVSKNSHFICSEIINQRVFIATCDYIVKETSLFEGSVSWECVRLNRVCNKI